MNIRLMRLDDIGQLRKIHAEFYVDQFPFPFDDNSKLLNKYVVVNDSDEIITFGALKVNVEGIVMTNKHSSLRARRMAFNDLLQCMQYDAANNGFNHIYGTVTEDEWAHVLIKKFGLREGNGKYIYLPV